MTDSRPIQHGDEGIERAALVASLRRLSKIACELTMSVPESIDFPSCGKRQSAYAEFIIDEDGCEAWRVTIDEMSPDADEFRSWLHYELAKRSWGSVEVITEW